MAVKKPQLDKTKLIAELPAACADEKAAVEFFERKRWGDCPCCPECGDTNVYTMKDRKTGERNSASATASQHETGTGVAIPRMSSRGR